MRLRDRRKKDIITKEYAVFVLTADENDHFAGGQRLLPAIVWGDKASAE